MTQTKPIVVIGSSNMDLVARTPRIPVPGETLTGNDFFMMPGGKGANQAVAAAKLGADVHFIARLGRDVFAEKSLTNFRNVGLNTTHVRQLDDVSSGIALIAVDDAGRNSIIVVPGANHHLTPQDIQNAEKTIASAGVVVCQLEIPVPVVEHAAHLARQHDVPFILDPAPAAPLNDELLRNVSIIKPNEVEAATLTGIDVTDESSARQAANALLSQGVKMIIITLGSRGSILADPNGHQFFSARKVKPLDSTAAGDAFTGALAFALSRGDDPVAAIQLATTAAAISVTRLGAQASMPTLEEVQTFQDHA